MRGKKTLAAAGLLVCTMALSGVAGAEQRVQQDRDMRVLLDESASSEERESNAGDQYSNQGSGATEENEGAAPNEERPEPPPEGESPGGDEQGGGMVSEENAPEATGSNADVGERDSASGAETPSGANGPPQREAKPERGEAVSPPQNEPPRSERPSRSSASRSGDVPEAAAERTVRSTEIQRRVSQLEEQQRAGEIRRAATGYSVERRPQELKMAREQIVAEPVDKAELRKYKELYEEAAEDYGFGEDWYVLAAVGKVESDHGQNMGPSSAGALGPMQFMPSTWDSYGVDANGDGKANIMDPEDAIPAAAKYLEAGGAPDDWYEALFTYNHAGWYVEDVLEVAEGYRQAAGDDEVGPYYLEDR